MFQLRDVSPTGTKTMIAPSAPPLIACFKAPCPGGVDNYPYPTDGGSDMEQACPAGYFWGGPSGCIPYKIPPSGGVRPLPQPPAYDTTPPVAPPLTVETMVPWKYVAMAFGGLAVVATLAVVLK